MCSKRRQNQVVILFNINSIELKVKKCAWKTFKTSKTSVNKKKRNCGLFNTGAICLRIFILNTRK